MEDEEGAEDAEVRSIITSPDGPRPQQLRSGRDFWQLYEKGETLGRGHFAKVKLVRERSSGAFFAAKIVIKQHDDDLATESMAREFLMLHSLDHANVMQMHEAYETSGAVIFVCRLVRIVARAGRAEGQCGGRGGAIWRGGMCVWEEG